MVYGGGDLSYLVQGWVRCTGLHEVKGPRDWFDSVFDSSTIFKIIVIKLGWVSLNGCKIVLFVAVHESILNRKKEQIETIPAYIFTKWRTCELVWFTVTESGPLSSFVENVCGNRLKISTIDYIVIDNDYLVFLYRKKSDCFDSLFAVWFVIFSIWNNIVNVDLSKKI